MMTKRKNSIDNNTEILIAEDSPTQAKQLKYILEKHNYKVIVAKNGKEALVLVHKHNPSAIISDIIMPEMNGYELCKEIKSVEATMDTPVILLTSLTSSEDVLEGISCGADNFITKPYREDYLISHVEQILANRKINISERVKVGLEITFGGKKRFITSSQHQMLTLLISTYEAAVQRNIELVQAQNELKTLNEHLEELVTEKTAKLLEEIAVHKLSEERVVKLNRVYALLSGINQTIVRIHNTEQLLKNVCLIAVDKGKLQSAWIGIMNHETNEIETSASAGLTNGKVSPDINSILRVISSGKHLLSNNINTDIGIAEIWKQNSLSLGFKSFAIFPIIVLGKTIGGFCIYSNEVGFFNEIEINQLDEVSSDISFALEYIQKESERKWAEKTLRASEIRYRQLFESAKDGILILDAESGTIIDVNPFLVKLLGYPKEKFYEKKIWDIGIFKDKIANQNNFLELQQKEYIRYDDLLLKTIDGRQIVVEFFSNVYFVNHNKVIQCNIRDVTERKRAEETILKERTLLRTLIDNLPVGIFVKDKEYRKIIFNPVHFKEIMGHIKYLGMNSEIDIMGKTDFEVFPKELAEKFFVEDQKVIRDGSLILNNEGLGFSEEGNQIWLLVSKIPLRDKNGEIIGMVGVTTDITQRKQAEEVLRESEKRLKDAQALGRIGNLEFDIENQKITWSDQTYKLYERDLALGPPTVEEEAAYYSPEQLKILRENVRRVIEEKKDFEYDLEAKLPSGKNVYFSTMMQPIQDSQGRVIKLFGTIQDITERRLAEETLRLSEEKFRVIFDNVSDGMFLVDLITRKFFMCNATCARMLGHTQEEFPNLDVADIHPEEDLHFIYEQIGLFSRGEEGIRSDIRFKRKNGDLFFTDLSPTLITIAGRRFLLIIFRDITERKRAENALRESEKRLKDAQTLGRVGNWEYDIKNQKIIWSDQTYELYERDPMLGPPTVEEEAAYYSPKQVQILHKYTQRVIDEKKDFEYDLEAKLPSGKDVFFSARIQPVQDKNGHVVKLFGTVQDITERKRAEEALAGERFLLTSLINTIPDSIYFKDKDSCFIRINSALAKRFGLNDPKKALGKTDFDFFSEEHARSAFENEQQILTTSESVIGLEEKEVWPDGHITWVSTTKVPLWGKDGNIIGVMGISRDITEHKYAEDELWRQKTEIEKQNAEYLALNDEYQSMNEELRASNEEIKVARDKAEESDRLKTAFLQNMSHEIRTPMNGILGFAELLKNPNLSGEKQEGFIKVIEQSGQRMLNIISDIVNISKIETGQIELDLKETNVNSLLQHLHIFFSPKAERKGLSLTFKPGLSDESCKIETDDVKLTQVLSNLISNAMKFTKSGAIDFGYHCKGQVLEFYVQDTGIGIAPEMRDIIFERFRQVEMSAARNYEGAGLGLTISKAFVEKLGGKIWVKSELEKGSTFLFNIPYNPKGIIKTEKPLEAGLEAKLLHVNILLVEDDDVCMELLKELLENENANLFFANNGQEALDMVKSTPEIQIVLMDLKMPILNGFDATRLIKKLKPRLPIIAQSAYAFSDDKDKAKMAGCDDFICKPLKRELLLSMINKQLTNK